MTTIGTSICNNTLSATVTVNSNPILTVNNNGPICGGQPLNLTVVQSSFDTYQWDGPASFTSNLQNPTIAVVTAANAGTYSVTATSGTCSAIGSTDVIIGTGPIVNPITNITVCNGETVPASAFTSPTAGATFDWTNSNTAIITAPSGTGNIPSFTAVNTGATPITTTISVTASLSGCTGPPTTYTITVNSNLVVNLGPDVSICPNTSTQLSASPNNADTYTWTSNPVSTVSGVYNPTVTPSVNTTYIVNVNDNGCVGSDDIIVTIRNLPAISAGNDATICAGVPTILTASNGLTYKWSNANETTTSITVSPTVESTYTVTGTDINGCSNIDQVVVFMNPPAVISAGNDVSICKNTSTQLGASGGSTYTWTATPASAVPNVSNPTVSPTITTTYCVTGTDVQGCTGSDCVVVTVNNLPLVSAGADQSICPYESATFTGSNASSFVWSPNGEITQSITIVQPVAQATYTVVGTDANGCTNNDQVVLYLKPLPTANAGTDKSICLNASTVLNASAGVSYLWDNGAGASSSATVTPLNTTLYTVTVTNVQGCTAKDDVNVTVNPLPTANAGNDQIICSGFCANLTGNNSTSVGGDTWKWLPTNQTSQSINVCPTNTTNYTLSVTDVNGCTGVDMVIVTVNPLPFVYAGIDQSICIGSSATLTGTGADSYSWDNGAGPGSPVTVTPPVVGTVTYTVTGTDINGCVATDAMKLTVNPIPTSDFTVNPNPVCARSFAAITYTGTATAGATYQWDFGGANNSTGAGAGPYQASWDNAGTVNVCLTVTQNGCISPQTCVPVEVLPLPAIVFSSDKIEGCQPLAVQFVDNTSAVPAAWSWIFGDINSSDNTSAAQNPTHNYGEPGQYSVRLTATSSEGCVNTLLFDNMITVYKNPVAEFYNLPEVGDCENNTISFFPSGTSNNVVAWEWDFGDYNANATNPNSSLEEKPEHKYVEIGNYDATLIVTTEHGCKDTINKNVFLRECYAFYIPNAFTPNDDGMNEYWGPKGIGIDPDNFEMYIFSRWGELLYKTSDLEKPWDGRPNGNSKICQQGVYSWIINVKEKDGVVHKYVGHLTLVK
jgi:gliding motility-associated-like protein